jgi:hypothetical protein
MIGGGLDNPAWLDSKLFDVAFQLNFDQKLFPQKN